MNDFNSHPMRKKARLVKDIRAIERELEKLDHDNPHGYYENTPELLHRNELQDRANALIVELRDLMTHDEMLHLYYVYSDWVTIRTRATMHSFERFCKTLEFWFAMSELKGFWKGYLKGHGEKVK